MPNDHAHGNGNGAGHEHGNGAGTAAAAATALLNQTAYSAGKVLGHLRTIEWSGPELDGNLRARTRPLAIRRIDPRPGSAPRWARICEASGRAASSCWNSFGIPAVLTAGIVGASAAPAPASFTCRLTSTKPTATTAITTTNLTMA